MDNKTNSQTDLLTTNEVAALLRLSPRTLEHWREISSGPTFVKVGRAVRYARTTIDTYLADSNYRNTAEASKTSQLLRYKSTSDQPPGHVPRSRQTRSAR